MTIFDESDAQLDWRRVIALRIVVRQVQVLVAPPLIVIFDIAHDAFALERPLKIKKIRLGSVHCDDHRSVQRGGRQLAGTA